MIRKQKLYSRPRKLFQTQRIKDENELMKKYALKNKTEIWKTLAKVDYYRHRAKALAYAGQEEQEVFFKKLRNIGLNANAISDVLDLQVEDLLKRRLPTIVAQKSLANTPQHARQLVVHKKVLLDGKVVNAPSYLVKVSEEKAISIKTKNKKAKVQEAVQPEKNVSQVEENVAAIETPTEEKE